MKKIQKNNDPKVGRVWKSVRFRQEEFTKPEEDATLAGAGEEDKFIKCFDDITVKELPWQAVKQAREQELKYLRELGVYEKVDEHAAVAKYSVTLIDSKWVDTDKAFEEEPMQIRSRSVAREFNSGNRPDLYAGNSPAGGSEGHHIHCCESQSSVLTDACRRFSCILPRQGSESCASEISSGRRSGKDNGKIGLLKKSMYGTEM